MTPDEKAARVAALQRRRQDVAPSQARIKATRAFIWWTIQETHRRYADFGYAER